LFRELLAVGDAVYLQTSVDSPLYSVQLLTEEQIAAVRKENAENSARQAEIARIQQKLTMEQRLDERAALLLELDKIEGALTRVVNSRGASITYYEVAHVGEDFVAFKSDDRETFVPFGSIRSMVRGGAMPTRATAFSSRDPSGGFGDRGRFASGGGFDGRAGFDGRVGFESQLQFLKPAPLAETIKKLFAEQEVEIVIDEPTNRLSITADRATATSIRRLVERLDTKTE
jgi:hypothetical protein